MRCEAEPPGPSLSHGHISSYLDSALPLEDPEWGHFDLSQHLCSKGKLHWMSLFTQSPKEEKWEKHVVSSSKVGIPRTQRVLGLS